MRYEYLGPYDVAEFPIEGFIVSRGDKIELTKEQVARLSGEWKAARKEKENTNE